MLRSPVRRRAINTWPWWKQPRGPDQCDQEAYMPTWEEGVAGWRKEEDPHVGHKSQEGRPAVP
jgi:hypothetical protein